MEKIINQASKFGTDKNVIYIFTNEGVKECKLKFEEKFEKHFRVVGSTLFFGYNKSIYYISDSSYYLIAKLALNGFSLDETLLGDVFSQEKESPLKPTVRERCAQ